MFVQGCGSRFATCSQAAPLPHPHPTTASSMAVHPHRQGSCPLQHLDTQSSKVLEMLEAGLRLACVSALLDTCAMQCSFAVLSGPFSGTSRPQKQALCVKPAPSTPKATPQAVTHWLQILEASRLIAPTECPSLRLRRGHIRKDQPGLSRSCRTPCSAGLGQGSQLPSVPLPAHCSWGSQGRANITHNLCT